VVEALSTGDKAKTPDSVAGESRRMSRKAGSRGQAWLPELNYQISLILKSAVLPEQQF